MMNNVKLHVNTKTPNHTQVNGYKDGEVLDILEVLGTQFEVLDILEVLDPV